MEYGNNIGNETVRCEYKELTWNHGGLEIDNELAEKLVNTSEWCFNDMILEFKEENMKEFDDSHKEFLLFAQLPDISTKATFSAGKPVFDGNH